MTKQIRAIDLPPRLYHTMDGPVPPADYVSNGSTCSPDFIGGADLRPAAHFHDYAYEMGGTEQDREMADRAFFRNLLTCGLDHHLANFYFIRLRFWGIGRFNYDRPLGFWEKRWLSFTCFFTRYLAF